MEFVNPFDPATGAPGDGSVPWQNGDPATGQDGSIPPVEAIEHPMRELAHLIDFALGDGSDGSGQDDADLEQVRKSVQALIVDALAAANFDASRITSGILNDLRLPSRLRAAGTTVTDWDDALENGGYKGDGAANAPGSGWFVGYVERLGETLVTQTVHDIVNDGSSDTKVWRRSKNGTWGAWFRVRLSAQEQEAVYLNLASMTGTLSADRLHQETTAWFTCPDDATTLTIAHSLGVEPWGVVWELRAKSAVNGFAAGEIIRLGVQSSYDGFGRSTQADASNVRFIAGHLIFEAPNNTYQTSSIIESNFEVRAKLRA